MLSVHVLVTVCAVLTLLFVSVSSFLQCNHSNTVNSCLVDTSLSRTAAKSCAKINYRCLSEINSCYYGLSLLRTLTQGPESVLKKGS